MARSLTAARGLDARLVVRRGGSFRLDVALSILPGQTVALLGPNGAGKSTAVAALAGLIPLDEGHITLDGNVLDDPGRGLFVPPERRNIGVVFQDGLLFPHLTVLENVIFGLRSRGVERGEARRRGAEWLERLGIGGMRDRRPADLSGGQAQRAALARALVGEPDLVLLDEPLSALDVTVRTQMRRLLSDHLSQVPGPRLLITHDPTEAFLLADVVHVIEGGSVTQVGTPDEIRLRPRTPYAADLAGANLIRGTASRGTVRAGSHPIHIADPGVSGLVLLTIRPSAIAVHRRRPEGSPRNTWPTKIERVEHFAERVRLRTGAPLPLTAEVTVGAAETLELTEGTEVWLAIKATEIGVQADT